MKTAITVPLAILAFSLVTTASHAHSGFADHAGSSCQPGSPAMTGISVGPGYIENASPGTESVVCPFVRDLTHVSSLSAHVLVAPKPGATVSDYHRVECTLWALDSYANVIAFDRERVRVRRTHGTPSGGSTSAAPGAIVLLLRAIVGDQDARFSSLSCNLPPNFRLLSYRAAESPR